MELSDTHTFGLRPRHDGGRAYDDLPTNARATKASSDHRVRGLENVGSSEERPRC